MKYGYFNNEAREYIITDPKLPTKWINYIGSLEFGGFVDHTGGALICKGDPAVNRITKYIPQLPDSEFKGESLYIRVNQEEKKVFSPYYTPTLHEYESYQCHVGLSYTKIISCFFSILCEVTIFIPINYPREIRIIKITNNSEKMLNLDIIPVVEYSHFDALKQFTNADWVPQTMQSYLQNNHSKNKILLQAAFMRKEKNMNYFTSNQPASSFETDRRLFLGDNGNGSWSQPKALAFDELNNSLAVRGDNIAALLHRIQDLKPGQTKTIVTQLGQTENIENELEKINHFYNEENVNKAFSEIQNSWQDKLRKLQIHTPDCDFNTLINIHNPRQCLTTLNWSRYLSLYQLGFGARGIGFRDTAQDILGCLIHEPIKAKNLIEKLLYIQKTDGSAMHQVNPKTMFASIGDAAEYSNRPDYYGDDHLWIILTICHYLKETGDMDFLKKAVPYYNLWQNQKKLKGTILEHLQKAIEFTQNNNGKNGLPLLGFADWNDPVNLPTGAQSSFIACLFGLALLEMIDLMEYLQIEPEISKYRKYFENMKKKFNACAWDGNWYIRYFDENNQPIGSGKNQQGKIYTNAQSWPVICNYATPEKAKKGLESVNKYLNTTKGIKLSYPGYDRYDENVGGITTYPPGAKENGGIFLHTNPWVIIAETILGNGSQAFHYFEQINPIKKNICIDEYECEPYCFAQNILGDEHPKFGLARNSWLTGTASWAYQAAVQYILGIKPTYKGLKINPCIPPNWQNFSIKRNFRKAEYHITFDNPDSVCAGIKSIELDNQFIESNILPIFSDNKIHDVKVTLG